MNRVGAESNKVSGMMVGIFLIIMVSYLIFIMLIQPWERKALLTEVSTIRVNVVDCDSGYPINNARVQFFTEEGVLLKDVISEGGVAVFSDYPDCFNIKTSFTGDEYTGVCLRSGEERIVRVCYEYPEANPKILYYTDALGVIGGANNDVISFKEFPNVILSYPLSNATLNYPSYFLYSNIFWSEGMGLLVNNINEAITKEVSLSMTMDSKRGNPTLVVYANKELIFSEKVSEGETVTAVIPKQSLNETIDFEVKCDFDGLAFWSTQDCNLTDIRVNQVFYTPKLESQEFTFTVDSVELNAESAELRFISLDEAISGVKAFINDVEVFSSSSLLSRNYTASMPVISLNLNDSNRLLFKANPGAEAWIRGVRLYFFTGRELAVNKTVLFSINNSQMRELDEAVINFYVSNVYLGGSIKFEVNGLVNYVSSVKNAGWNSVRVNEEFLRNGNTVKISAFDGRFLIDEVRVTYE